MLALFLRPIGATVDFEKCCKMRFELLTLVLYRNCATILRVALGYFDTDEDELLEMKMLTSLALLMNWW